MDLKERLERLDEISGAGRETREEIISDLRKRLERLGASRQRWGDERRDRPIAMWIAGEEVGTPHGTVFMAEKIYGSGHRHGGVLLDRVMEIPTHPASLVSGDSSLTGLDFSNALFIDTETTGLAGGTGTYAFLVGVGYFERGRFVTRQFFLRDFSEERAMLWMLADLAKAFRFLVTFNGKRFDIPLLETRFILSRMETPFRELPHYDLLYPSRKIWRGAFENCRLITLESCVLEIHRQDDVPSEMIPDLYFDYLRRGDGSEMHRVFDHNRMDVLSLVTLAARIHELLHDPRTVSRNGRVEAYALGKLFLQGKRTGQAIECFREALRRCKTTGEWEILKALSLALKRENRMDQAAAIWMEMISYDRGREFFPYEEVAKFYEHRVGDFGEALRWVEEAFKQLRGIRSIERAALEHRYQRLIVRISRQRAKRKSGYVPISR
jgi:uncharacterized protein YprB with RNaseH-like and TPR domain